MKTQRLCESSSYKNFSIRKPLKATVIWLLVFVFLVNPHISSSEQIGGNYGSIINPYWQFVPPAPPNHINSLSESHLNKYNRGNVNGFRSQHFTGQNNRIEPVLSFLAQMGADGRGGQTRIPKEYLEFLLLNSNANLASQGNNPGANPAKLFNHPNEVSEQLSPTDGELVESQPDPYELSSQNHLGSPTKRNSPNGYIMCPFKICHSQMGVSWKRFLNPTTGSREAHLTP